jgi:hypothetical protein
MIVEMDLREMNMKGKQPTDLGAKSVQKVLQTVGSRELRLSVEFKNKLNANVVEVGGPDECTGCRAARAQAHSHCSGRLAPRQTRA